ncbi:hypothetical protein J7E50_21490 [Pedobacter sp. ISL-68]|uniref:hypothetical protein n=1 Tax=unclassified Pedobacter TaxID=2628915 RepID=UPI001BE6033F|nr:MULTISPECIES: hypothetical protein [unclassified Pedobacter]MBT2563787.1 hypothetical protein [Pedobacter sp. ISL-64]MBT2592807.1 hypothetical protein [Pedobacter sp. ISL-68]
MDPIAAEYPELTPYQFASNRPIDGIDQDGLEYFPRNFETSLIFGDFAKPKSKRLTDKQIKENGARMNRMAITGTAIGTGLGLDILSGGRFSTFLGASELFSAFEHKSATTDEAKKEQSQRAKNALANSMLNFGLGYTFNKMIPIFAVAGKTVLNKMERIGIFMEELKLANPVKNQTEAINLINSSLDKVEDAYSGIKKAPGIPDGNDGRMYGILDKKYVKTLEDGTQIATTKGQRIVLNTDGSFKIQTKDGSKTLFEKAGVKK